MVDDIKNRLIYISKLLYEDNLDEDIISNLSKELDEIKEVLETLS
tara:strand:+ start:69 stop:203 length:135 start_codon:yes stop_codon:yes gene_type:complete